jgi:hypothetical protein
MARAILATAARSGFVLTPVLTAAVADGDVADVGSRVWVQNDSAVTVTVTAVTTGEVSGLAVADLAVAVPAGTTRLVGPFSNLFKQPDDAVEGAGKVLVNYSAVTDVLRGAVST